MAYLKWIADEDLKNAVLRVLATIHKSEQNANADISRNGIDPFSVLFNLSCLSHDVETWRRNEIIRQAEKGLTNAIGTFHQEIIAHVNGWRDPHNNQTFDLINESKMIIVEMKNKHNTLNAEGKKGCWKKLYDAVASKTSSFHGYTAYCVNIVPKEVEDIVWQVPDNATTGGTLSYEKVRLIDGKTFYSIATGDKNALRNLLAALPKVLQDLAGKEISKESIQFAEHLYKGMYEGAFKQMLK